jgi:hypothetical protein
MVTDGAVAGQSDAETLCEVRSRHTQLARAMSGGRPAVACSHPTVASGPRYSRPIDRACLRRGRLSVLDDADDAAPSARSSARGICGNRICGFTGNVGLWFPD